MSAPGEGGSIAVYRAPESRAYAPPPAESDDFEPTPAELRTAFAGVVEQRHGPNAPLMTSAMRARRAAMRADAVKTYDTIRVRVRFSDRTQIETALPHSATIADVYAFVDGALHDDARVSSAYVLFQSPPKRDFARDDPSLRTTTLAGLGFAPAAVLGIRWSDMQRNTGAAAAPLRADLLARARDVPTPPAFGSHVPSVRGPAGDAPNDARDARDAREKRKFAKVRA
ncbi:hypothetical protein MSPP1_002220 [Malassezia sp. CBS 17886]|nr:hypothetical protein MSPP1_002220 [Malassezia sp. CBS 17886]